MAKRFRHLQLLDLSGVWENVAIHPDIHLFFRANTPDLDLFFGVQCNILSSVALIASIRHLPALEMLSLCGLAVKVNRHLTVSVAGVY